MQRGAEFSIMLGQAELMNSRRTGSERALATMACQRIRDRRNASVLIGGLGMGFTLRAAQAELRTDARITVAELVAEVVAWARGPMAELFGDCLDDLRLNIRQEDVGITMKSFRSEFDAILLDVDNGPEGLTQAANSRLYSIDGLRRAHLALRPHGVLAVWGSAQDEGFSRRLGRAGFSVSVAPVRADGARGSRNFIWIASRQ
jgi:spermidine synthase